MALLFIPHHECWDPENQGRLKDLAFLELRAKSLGGSLTRLLWAGAPELSSGEWKVETGSADRWMGSSAVLASASRVALCGLANHSVPAFLISKVG